MTMIPSCATVPRQAAAQRFLPKGAVDRFLVLGHVYRAAISYIL
jgi:hypothetical protein